MIYFIKTQDLPGKLEMLRDSFERLKSKLTDMIAVFIKCNDERGIKGNNYLALTCLSRAD